MCGRAPNANLGTTSYLAPSGCGLEEPSAKSTAWEREEPGGTKCAPGGRGVVDYNGGGDVDAGGGAEIYLLLEKPGELIISNDWTGSMHL
jgi:hypothetical protein